MRVVVGSHGRRVIREVAEVPLGGGGQISQVAVTPAVIGQITQVPFDTVASGGGGGGRSSGRPRGDRRGHGSRGCLFHRPALQPQDHGRHQVAVGNRVDGEQEHQQEGRGQQEGFHLAHGPIDGQQAFHGDPGAARRPPAWGGPGGRTTTWRERP